MDFEGVSVGVGHRPCFESTLLDVVEDSIRASVSAEFESPNVLLRLDQVFEGASFEIGKTMWYLSSVAPIKKDKPKRKKGP